MKRTSTGKREKLCSDHAIRKGTPILRDGDDEARVSEAPRWDPGDGPDETFPTYKGGEPSKQQSTAKVCKQSARANPVQFHVAHMRGNRFKKVLSASRTIRGFKPTRTDTGAAVGRTRKG